MYIYVHGVRRYVFMCFAPFVYASSSNVIM